MAAKKLTSNLCGFRRNMELNQADFWDKIGVGQSGGCRYESGRNMPKPTSMLVDLAYGKNPLKELARLRGVTVAQLVEGGK